MALNTRGIFDPRFTKAFARVDQGGMSSSVLIRRRKPSVAEDKAVWDYSTGDYVGSDFDLIWTGPARVQPSQDWRAKDYTFADTTTATNAVRFVLPLIRGGMWADGVAHELNMEDQVIITDLAFEGLDAMKRYAYSIRSPLMSGNAGSMKALCDVDVKYGVNRDN